MIARSVSCLTLQRLTGMVHWLAMGGGGSNCWSAGQEGVQTSAV